MLTCANNFVTHGKKSQLREKTILAILCYPLKTSKIILLEHRSMVAGHHQLHL